jgi:hypothetical protein
MRQISRALASLAIIGAVSLAAAPAWATVIYTTFGLGDSYDTSVSWVIGNVAEPPAQQVAVSFVPGFDSALDSIRVGVIHFANPNDYVVTLASDSSVRRANDESKRVPLTVAHR